MKSDDKHKQLRQLIIEAIFRTATPDKISKTGLNKLKDEELVDSLYHNSIFGEREFWRGDIQRAAMKIDPNSKFSTNATSIGLINKLIKLVEKSKEK